MAKEKTTTIRTVLELLGGAEYVEMSSWIREHDLDREVVAQFCTGKAAKPGDHGTGECYVSCGGEALVGFYDPGPIRMRWPMYLVLDDSDERTWHYNASQLSDDDRRNACAVLGRCPRKILRLVQSA